MTQKKHDFLSLWGFVLGGTAIIVGWSAFWVWLAAGWGAVIAIATLVIAGMAASWKWLL